MPQLEHICVCGKKFAIFRSYNSHVLKHKCHTKSSITPPDTQNPPQNPGEPTLEKTNINLVNNPNQIQETILPDIEQKQTKLSEIIAYKSSSNNINPKVKCDYCHKLYSNHHIKTHKSRCKHKYKETYEYRLLMRAGIQNIPETYIEIHLLFVKLLEDNPGIFNNLQPDNKAFEEFEKGLPQRGRPRKPQININNEEELNIPRKTYKKQITINTNIQNTNIQNTNIQNTNIQNNNITQNNINVFINPVYQESIAHITPERQMFIILQRLHAFKALIDSVYETPANHNIYISDRKGRQVNFLDNKHGINNGSAQDIIGNIAMQHLGTLDNFIEANKNDVPTHRQNDLKFLEELLLNEKNNPCVIKQLNEKVMSLSGSAKILLDKYQKEKIIEYISSLPVGYFSPNPQEFNPEFPNLSDTDPSKIT